jgi:hypothetical protein
MAYPRRDNALHEQGEVDTTKCFRSVASIVQLDDFRKPSTVKYYCDTSLDGQRARLLDVLKVTTVTSLEARDNLEISKPHECVDVLREAGHNIQANLLWLVYPNGVLRYATQYELKPGPYQPWMPANGDSHD